MVSGNLDRRSVVSQLSAGLRDLIAQDALGPGDRLPSESQLAARFQVARGTVREALRLLEQSGLLEAQHGRGHFVSAAGLSVDRPVTEYESVTEMLAGLGYRPEGRVLSASHGEANEPEAKALGIPVGRPVVRLRRVRAFNGKPLIYELNTFDVELLRGESLQSQDFSGSLNEWLDARGRGPVSSAARIRATLLPEEFADLEEPEQSEPWLLITEQSVDRSGMPVLYSQDFHRGDVFSFHVLRRRTNQRRGTANE